MVRKMTDDREPGWLDTIRTRVEHCRSADPDPSVNGAHRTAAVLVLLSGNDDRPTIVLTERAATLTNYPGTLVFPGGSTETGDDGPVATALRESAEEIGIDPTHVHIIGSLPPLWLSATRFLVTPVVGWCTRLQLTDFLNPDEVAVVIQIPLREFAKTSGRVQRNGTTDRGGHRYSFEGTAVGDMASTVIDALLDQYR